MQSFIKLFFASALFVVVAACGSSKKESSAALTEKKESLVQLKKQYVQTGLDIKQLEQDIAKLDTGSAKADIAKLVVIDTIRNQKFTHFIDLQGKIDAENVSYITPRGMGGQVRALYVKVGDNVRKGQVLLKLDDAIVRQNVVAARQGMAATRTQLELAKNLYQRQKNLWDQNIGTEIQLLQAKTNVDALENNLKTQLENVKSAQEQLATATVVSNVNGVAEEVNIHVGETFTGSPAQGIKIVNNSNLKVVTIIPENYLGRVLKGTPVVISIPDLNKSFNSTIYLVSQTINASSSGFTAHAKLPSTKNVKPNLTAIVRIEDYVKENALTIPVNTLQTDETGKFVYVAMKEKNGLVARKRNIQVGEFYNNQLEVKTGLEAGDIVVTEGYQNLYDGQLLNVAAN